MLRSNQSLNTFSFKPGSRTFLFTFAALNIETLFTFSHTFLSHFILRRQPSDIKIVIKCQSILSTQFSHEGASMKVKVIKIGNINCFKYFQKYQKKIILNFLKIKIYLGTPYLIESTRVMLLYFKMPTHSLFEHTK
jgi:hypothetical protein